MNLFFLNFLIGLVTCIIGAMPFGLVNLSVVDISINKSEKHALSFSIGASFIEVLFAISAIIAGKQLTSLIEGNEWVEIIVVLVLFSSSIYFFLKKYKPSDSPRFEIPFLFKGMFFNLISIQVFLYWFLAIAFLENNGKIESNLTYIIGFVLGVGSGKMLTLLFYRLISKHIKKKASNISHKINQVIGSLLLIVTIFQLIKAFAN